MAFLSINQSKNNLAEEKNTGSGKTTAKRKDGQSPIAMMKVANEQKNDDNHSSYLWKVFQDSLFSRETESKDSGKSLSLLNEELKRMDTKVASSRWGSNRQSSNSSSSLEKEEGDHVFLPLSLLRELEQQERSLPDRWVDFFCIIGLDPDAKLVKEEVGDNAQNQKAKNATTPRNKPILLDRYPKEDHPENEFPEHLPTFCFPNGGCRPLRYKTRRHEGSQPSIDENKSSKKAAKKNKKKNQTTNIKYHHNVPEPTLCSFVLTSGSGHRLYCTSLTVYEMRLDKYPKQKEKRPEKQKKVAKAKSAPVNMKKKWWEEPSIDSKSKHNEEDRKREEKAQKSDGGSSVSIQKNEEPDENAEYYWMVPKSLVILSHYPFFEAQSIALRELFYTVQSGSSPIPFERYVAHLVDDIPLPGSGVGKYPKGKHTVVEWSSWISQATSSGTKLPPTIRLERPPPNRLPLFNVSMEPLFRTLSLSNILVLWATLLQEGQVVLACSNGDTTALLTPIAEALLTLLFPLEWQGIYIPVLPNEDSVLDVLEAPVPYLIGLVTAPSNAHPHKHPRGVLWCDLDNDVLHFGFKDNHQYLGNENGAPEEIRRLPALPRDPSMNLKAELEEIADPLFLPTIEGIKGRMTVGDRTVELDNALREPYAQRTKLFHKPMPTPRKYILTQSAKIPPRGKTLCYEDFSIIPKKNKNKTRTETSGGNASSTDKKENLWSQLEDIRIPCGEDTTTPTTTPSTTGENKEKKIDGDTAAPKGDPRDITNKSQDSSFFVSLKRQSRSVQAHVDRAMAVFGQDYATPSAYACHGTQQFGDDMLGQQDEIAANFFFADHEKRDISTTVRKSFLKFFLAIFSRYEFYVNSRTNQLDGDRLVKSMNLPSRQRKYMKDVVSSQMFERFLHDTRSIRNRRLFNEHIINFRNGDFTLEERKTESNPGTPLLNSIKWRNPKIIRPGHPCSVGLREGLVHCEDRRFPDSLNPEECITKKTVSSWKAFMDGAFCSSISSCV
mmetsp:Transcript_25967/g.61089  ORF Transcript_25967/g.61089 Transcript_25967/m.61089 type:complete len:1004 (+) Transcript_25967:97-3108(+)